MVEPRNRFPEGTSIRRVLDYAMQEFFAKGVKLVTMDDIAKGLQMSKRTLYQLFADKEQLIIACLEVLADQERFLVQQLINEEYNVLEIILRVLELRMKRTENVSPQYIIDIGRYKSVKEYMQRAYNDVQNRSAEIFKTGVQQGLFRGDVNVHLLMRCMFTSNESLVSTLLSEYGLSDCFINVVLFHLRGCCTPKGIELIDNFLDYYRKKNSVQ